MDVTDGRVERARVAVLLACAQPLLRLGMRMACVEGGLNVLGEADDHRALKQSVGALAAPSVIVSDIELLQPDAVATVRELANTHRVLLLDEEGLDRPRFLRAGASGFICCHAAARALCEAVETAQRGQLVLSGYHDTGAEPHTASPPPSLTHRERDVLRLIATGAHTGSAAQDLHLSPTTLKTHLRNASAKLGTRNRTAAVARATELGLLD